MKFFHLIWGNLRRKQLRTALTILSILVAFVLFGFLSAIKQALAGGITLEGANRLVVRHKVSLIQLLPESYKARMERIPGVSGATHLTWFGGVYQEPKNFFPQMPVVPEEFLQMHPEFILKPEEKAAWMGTRTACIVGRKTAERFKWKIGDRIPIQSAIWMQKGGSHAWEFEIAGIFDGKERNTDTTQMFFRFDYFDEAREQGKGLVGWYIVRVTDPARSPQIAQAIDAEFANSAAETKAETEGAFVQAFTRQIGDIAMITASIMGAVFFTILLVTGNTMSQSVRERAGEIGVLKAIGFTSTQVLGLILAESCLVSILGGIAGLGVAVLMISRGDPTGGMLPLFAFPAHDVLIGLVISIMLGLVTGVFPAIHAMRLRVADALRRM
jgi:putative ABC transport system permease protein